MVRRGSSIGFFGIFGRSEDLRRLDAGLRQAGLHPALVPEGVKLAATSLIADADEPDPPPERYPPVAELMAFCALGEEVFGKENGAARLATICQRVEAALEAGAGRDAQIILLMLHARLIQPDIIDRYGIYAENGD
ncbi:hypothetical protein [Chelativorans sp. Marseille-P2723]|uniref:hypothetical protein n=1 Tax=Chelativorans sp. Marseille-P2723 TaxID=2709133 RepID=UPI001570E243|nr:hypothetical protein [Chelativorans sp. Marseille-P2723]